MSLQSRWKLADAEKAKAYLAKKDTPKRPKKKKRRKDAGKPRKTTIAKVESRSGPISAAEKELVERFLLSRPDGETIDTATRRAKALAVVMGRSVETVRKAIVRTADLLAERSEDYANMHFVAAKIAASKGDASPSQWALERISVEGVDGKGRTRIVEPVKSEQDVPTMPTINIGLALGGIANRAVAMKQIPGASPITLEVEDTYPEDEQDEPGDEP